MPGAILATPKAEWPVIDTEPATVGGLYQNYICILAAIPAVCGFIKMSVLGVSIPFAGTVRVGMGAGIGTLLVSYVLALVSVYVAKR